MNNHPRSSCAGAAETKSLHCTRRSPHQQQHVTGDGAPHSRNPRITYINDARYSLILLYQGWSSIPHHLSNCVRNPTQRPSKFSRDRELEIDSLKYYGFILTELLFLPLAEVRDDGHLDYILTGRICLARSEWVYAQPYL